MPPFLGARRHEACVNLGWCRRGGSTRFFKRIPQLATAAASATTYPLAHQHDGFLACTSKQQLRPGDVLVERGDGVKLAVRQPTYEVLIQYDACRRPLEGASRLWAHAGHSGWQDTVDVELFKGVPDGSGCLDQVWCGTYCVPAGRLSAAAHAEVQLVFKGECSGGLSAGGDVDERWDNNGGRNWSVAVELSEGQGLAEMAEQASSGARALVSSLLLRVEALMAQRSLTTEQGTLLRMMAWNHDAALLRLYEQVRNSDDGAVASALLRRCGSLRRPGLHVVHIASEMAPIAKVGGLADVVTSLAKAHQATGTLVEIVLPKYSCIKYGDVFELRQLTELQVPWGTSTVRTVVWSGIVEGLPVYFLEPQSSHRFFWRSRFYGEDDDTTRFLFFAAAAVEYLAASGRSPDVLHLHDWQSAAVAPLLRESPRLQGNLARARVVVTIHNIAFQGWLSPDFLDVIHLDQAHLHVPERMLDDTRPGFTPGQWDMNLLKGGVVYADWVTTVSPTYAREVFNPAFGMGMQGVLATHSHKFCGVLNGIDHESWDPASDPFIPAHFNASDTSGKQECKWRLLQELGLPFEGPGASSANSSGGGRPPVVGGRPLLAVVTRLTEQKGLPLLLHGIAAATAAGAQVVLLGSAPDPKVQLQFEAAAAAAARGNDVRMVLRHDEALSHRVYAASDIILIPSFFEPCGLTQLISLRYGTIPVVRETGGLADTVHDVAHSSAPDHARNGFTFSGKDAPAVEAAVWRAVDAYYQGHEWWRTTLVPRALNQDWSWSRSAQDYLEIYRRIVRHGG